MNTPISFEIAKLLKEKGFNLKVRSMYCEEKLHSDTKAKGNYNDISWVRTWRNSPNDDTISAPTIAEVVMWLYDKHGIWVMVNLDLVGRWYYDTYTIENGLPNHNTYKKIERFNSPTEAYNSAIEYTLKNLI